MQRYLQKWTGELEPVESVDEEADVIGLFRKIIQEVKKEASSEMNELESLEKMLDLFERRDK